MRHSKKNQTHEEEWQCVYVYHHVIKSLQCKFRDSDSGCHTDLYFWLLGSRDY